MTAPKPIESPPPAEAPADPLAGLVRGRIVYYFPTPAEGRYADPGPWPAMVTHVGLGGACTLNVNLPRPTPIGTDPVARMENVPFSPEGAGGSWRWMYVGQNTRYEVDRKA